jgi:uncharacterized protein (TIGR02265 family)
MTSAFDVEAHIARVPAHATVKGMSWNDLHKVARSVGAELPPGRRTTFNDYPLAEYMRAVAEIARLAQPSEPVLEGIRQVGKRAFLTFSTSLTGRVLLAIAGRDLGATLNLVSEAYKRSLSPGSARLGELREGRAIVELREIWNYPLAYQVGVFEEAMAHFGHTGTVQVRSLSPCDADYLLQWR